MPLSCSSWYPSRSCSNVCVQRVGFIHSCSSYIFAAKAWRRRALLAAFRCAAVLRTLVARNGGTRGREVRIIFPGCGTRKRVRVVVKCSRATVAENIP